MDFLKNISASLSKAAEATTKKASELTDTAKLKIKQNRITSDINETYNKIGALIYKQYKESGDESAAIAELCLAIDKSNEELDAVNAEIEAIKEAAEAAKAAAAAEKAAAKAQTEEAPAEETVEEPKEEVPVRFCSGCGAELSAGAMFCSKCGQKQE